MSGLRLRGYQQEALDAIDKSLQEYTRVAAVIPTGGGKTVVFAHLIAQANEAGKKALVLVHREELAEQAKTKIHSVAPHLTVGIVKAERNEVDADVIVASVQTLANRVRREAITGIGVVIVDECFPAGTMVGDKPIEKIQVGDLVPSWDEETGREVLRPVTRVMKKRAERLVRVDFEDRTSVFCTPNHPFLTTEGWVPAGLLRGESAVSFMHHDDAPRDILRDLSEDRRAAREEEDRLMAPIWSRLLQPGASGRVGLPGPISSHVPYEPALRLGSHEGTEPDASRGDAAEDGRVASTSEASPEITWWQRRARARAAAAAGRFPGVADRGVDRSEGRRAPVPLQGGLRASVDEGLRRGGWGIPFRAGPPSLRPEEGRETVVRRVAHVQVLEPGGDGTYGGMCADGAVYNLEVAGTHTYLIEDGIVVHNCHHAVARTWMETLQHFGCYALEQERDLAEGAEVAPEYDGIEATPCVGFTATLNRTDGKGLGDVWETVAFEKDILWMIDHGYLTDVRGQAITVDGLDLATIARNRGDYAEGQLGEAMEAAGAGEVIANAYLEHASVPEKWKDAEGYGELTVRQGVLFAPTVATAYSFADSLNGFDIPAAVVEGNTSTEDRALIYKRYEAGEIRVLCNAMVLTEGWDAPWCEVIVVARPTQSAALYTQMVGRGLRPWPGKDDALVLDVVGISGRHKLQSLTDLIRTPVQDGESYAEARERLEKELQQRLDAPERVRGTIAAQQVELFANSHSAWLQTARGTWFISTRAGLFFLWPALDGDTPGTWRLGYKKKVSGPSWEQAPEAMFQREQGWLLDNLELGYAMAHGEAMAEADDPTTSLKDRAWRRTKPSEGQVKMALRLKVAPIDEIMTMRKGAISDLISIKVASRMLDL